MLMVLRCALTELFAVRQCMHATSNRRLWYLYNTVTIRFVRNRSDLLTQFESLSVPRENLRYLVPLRNPDA